MTEIEKAAQERHAAEADKRDGYVKCHSCRTRRRPDQVVKLQAVNHDVTAFVCLDIKWCFNERKARVTA